MGIGTAIRRAVGLETKASQPASITDEKAARIWSQIFGLGETFAGKTVTVDTALQLSAVWACVQLVSETVATLPLMVYRRHPDGGREVASDHPLYALLHDAPNADQTAVEFWEGLVLSLCLHGNALAEKIRRNDGTLLALEPLSFDRVTVKRDEFGAREYRYADPIAKRTRVLSEDEVFHVRAFGNGGDLGLSPISYARQTLGIAMAADEASGKMFANGVRPSGVLQMDTFLKSDQREQARENIVKPMSGSTNAGSVFLLEGGMKFTPVSITPKDAEMATARRWHVEEICRWFFRTPPILIGHASEGQTMWGTGVGQIKQGWYDTSLRSLLRRIEASIFRSLLSPSERQTLSAEFVVEGFLRADSEKRFDLYSKAVQNGLRTRNEIRELENLPRVEGGDELTVQSNLLPLSMLGKVKPDASANEPDQDEKDGEDGPDGRRPFDETKASFDGSKHPRDENGRFQGRGAGRGRRVTRHARRSWADRLFDEMLDLGEVDARRFGFVSKKGVKGWRFGLKSDAVRHGRNKHSDDKQERKLGQRAITPADYASVQSIIRDAKDIRLSDKLSRGRKLPVVEVRHTVGQWNYTLELEVQSGRRALMVHTLWKRPK